MSAQRFTPEFKEEAVKQVTERGHSVAEVAARLGVSTHSLYKWVKAVSPGRSEQQSQQLLVDKIEGDLTAIAVKIEQRLPPPTTPERKQQPKRQPLPANLPRREIRHEPEPTTYQCGCPYTGPAEWKNCCCTADRLPGRN